MDESLENRCKGIKLENTADPFTIKGYNDKPKPCLELGCNGTVYPTRNANVDRCDVCSKRTAWRHYIKK